MADIVHLKFVGSGKSIIYLDNIYFHKVIPSSASEINSNDAISYYPNLTTGILNISSALAIRSVEVSNLAGQLMQSFAVGTFNSSIDLSGFNAGYYIVSITLEDETQSTQMILKL